MKFYGNTDDANSGSGTKPTLKIGVDFGSGGGKSAAPKPDTSIGKGSFDFGDALGSIGETAGNFKDFATGFAGGIGIPGGPNLGDVAELPGGAVDAIGGLTLPYLGNDPTRQGAKLGDVPGVVGDTLGFLGKQIEGGVAAERLNAQREGRGSLLGDILDFDPMRAGAATRSAITGEQGPVEITNDLPPEYQARLDAGEDVDKLAKEMAEAGVGYSSDFGRQMASTILLDPLNLILPGIGKAATIGKQANRALQAGESIGVGRAFMGTAYGAASRGLSGGGQALMDTVLGPATSGVFHALGTKPYFALRDGAARIGPEYGQAFEDAFARGAAQLPRAVIARYMAEEATGAIKRYGDAAVKRLTNDIGGTIEARLAAIRQIRPGQIERRTEEALNRFAPDFAGHTDEGRFVETRDKLAQITGMSSEDAARAIGSKADLRTAQQVHLAFYGKAGDDLARAKALTTSSKVIDPERLTLISDDTLTAERAADILSGKADVVSAVEQYSILRNRFGSTAFEHGKVTDFLQKLVDEKALSHAVLNPVTGLNKLPPALRDWRIAYGKFGYEIGFAPKDGWKTIIDDAGDVTYADPFAHFVSEADPLTVRNPLGRFMDSLFRGSTQTSIISDSRARMVKLTRGSGISANEARAVHNRILVMAADASVSPRGLSLQLHNGYGEIFREVLGEAKFKEFIQKVDPDFAVMKSFEGNLSRVGLTQKITGKVKTGAASRGNHVAAIADGIYPQVRFRISPLFQAQELTESPIFNLLRGATKRTVSEDVKKVYDELSDLPDFQYLAEAGYTLNIAGATEVARTITAHNTLLGKALSRVPNVKAYKERQRVIQVFSEHGPAFEEAVNGINPKLWATMKEAYGTTDPHEIADAFLRERMALAGGEMDEAMAVFDGARPVPPAPAARAGARAIPNAPFTPGDTPLKTFDSIMEGMGFPARNADGTASHVELPRVDGKIGPSGKWEFPDGYPQDAPMVPALDNTYHNASDLKLIADDGTPMEVATFKNKFGNTFGVPGTERPIQYVYRAVSEEDYQGILARGNIKSDGRMNLSADEGTVASQRDPSWYLPGDTVSAKAGEHPGRILKIKVQPGDGWHLDGRDSYIKTDQAVPVERIELVSPKIVKTKTSSPSKYNTPERTYPDDVSVALSRFEADAPPSSPGGARAFSPDEETVWQAFRESFRATSEQAFKTHYFNPVRGFLERSINHPYLGIYPASYMWGKVLPEFARFLLKRPFGLNAPLLGLSAYQRVQQSVIAALAMDPEMQEWVNDSSKPNGGAMYLVQQLLPGTPENLPANLPAWARHLSQDVTAGKKIDPQAFAKREAGDLWENAAGPVKSFNTVAGLGADLGDLAGDLFKRLDNAATQLDAAYPRR